MTGIFTATDSETAHAPEGPRQLARLVRAVTGTLTGWLSGLDFAAELEARAVGPAVRAFLRTWPDRPVADNAGGSRFNACLVLFVLTRLICPRRIIESGTHLGQNAWFLGRACPQARVTTYDIVEVPGRVTVPGVDYRLSDWRDDPPDMPEPAHTLIFFDDHVSHARRLVEAARCGVRWVVLDDDAPAAQLHVTGRPPVPTISMMHDPLLRDGEVLSWYRRGKLREAVVDRAEMAAARSVIAGWSTIPDLVNVTGFNPQRRMVLVRLVNARTPAIAG